MGDVWKVQIIEYESGEIVKEYEKASERSADRFEDALNINLDHARYYTVIEKPGKQPK